MRAFDPTIVELLNTECGSGEVYFVGLGQHDFQLSLGGIRHLRSTCRVGFCISGKFEIWDGGASEIPVWKLVGQQASCFELNDRLTLRLNFVSGDYVEFHSDEGPYESFLAELAPQGNAAVLEIY